MALSRRSLFSGPQAEDLTHIASLVVHCRPEKLADANARISALPHVEIPASDDRAKLVVLMEMREESELLQRIDDIEAVPGVVAATLVFHQVDEL